MLNGVPVTNQMSSLACEVCCCCQNETSHVIDILHFHSINVPITKHWVCSDQENVAARWSNFHSWSLCPENGCSIKYVVGMKTGKGHYHAEWVLSNILLIKVMACSSHEMAQGPSDTHGLVAGHSYIHDNILFTYKYVGSQMTLLPCL